MKTIVAADAVKAEILEVVEGQSRAILNKDIDQLVACYANDIVSFDVVDPLQNKGIATVRKRLADWLSSYQSDIHCEIREVNITVSETVAFSHHLNRISGVMKNGEMVDMWLRSTLCFEKLSGKWHIVHEHVSEPFNPQTGQASIHLKP